MHRMLHPAQLLLCVQTTMRSMNAQELSSAQWALIDLGSAGRLLPPTPAAAAAAAAAGVSTSPGLSLSPSSSSSSSSSSGLAGGLGGLFSWLPGANSSSSKGSAGAAAAAATPSRLGWRVAEGSAVPYETPAYTPPEVGKAMLAVCVGLRSMSDGGCSDAEVGAAAA
jgi:hypothetical protein